MDHSAKVGNLCRIVSEHVMSKRVVSKISQPVYPIRMNWKNNNNPTTHHIFIIIKYYYYTHVPDLKNYLRA